jgi:heme/copper-type cytochrome/quinol oxidase subunit 2
MSRVHKHCQYCGAGLPEHLLATEAEIKAEFEAWQRAEKQKQARQAEADAEEQASDIDDIGYPTSGLG